MIYGSFDRKRFLDLKKINKISKTDNISMLLLMENTFDVFKMHHLSKKKSPPIDRIAMAYYGINSPNVSTVLESKKIPPFFYENWIVAFSGEIVNIENVLKFSKKCDFAITDNNSSLVNCVLNKLQGDDINEAEVLKETFSLIEGSYSSWVFNIKTKNCFLLKCNSDLYANIYDNDFSSKEKFGFEPLNDGIVYQLTREGITSVDYFECSIC